MPRILMLFFGLFLLTACQSGSDLYDIDGNAIRLKDFRGKWVIINYWASWCTPCREEIPELNAFYKTHGDKDAVILGVSYDQDNEDNLKRAVKKMGIHFPVLSTDPANLLGIDNVAGLPTSYLISPQGKLQRTLLGGQTQKSLEKAIGSASENNHG